MEVYVDDMIVKMLEGKSHAGNIEDVLGSFRKYNMHINPTKCSFGVHARNIFGLFLTKRDIEVIPDKCQAIIDMRKKEKFEWTREYEEAFPRVKAFLIFLHILTFPRVGSPRLLYHSITNQAISSILV